MIKADDVIVVFRCCECGNETTRPLKGITILPSVCGECNELENYIEPIGVLIDQAEQAKLTEHFRDKYFNARRMLGESIEPQ